MKKIKVTFEDKYNNLDSNSQKDLLEKAIRSKCVECCAGSKKEALTCQIKDCPLNRFIFFLNI